jgi:hypothetical protein
VTPVHRCVQGTPGQRGARHPATHRPSGRQHVTRRVFRTSPRRLDPGEAERLASRDPFAASAGARGSGRERQSRPKSDERNLLEPQSCTT